MATIQQLKERVLAYIGQAEPQTDDGIAVRFNIETFLNQATTELLLSAPLHLVPIFDFTNATLTKKSDGSGTVTLPPNFLKLVDFMMIGWVRPVTEPLTPAHRDYTRQHNRITMGSAANPAVIIRHQGSDAEMDYYSLQGDDEHKIAAAHCIVQHTPTEMPEILTDALCWLTAANILAVNNEGDAAQFAKSKYEQTILMHYGNIGNRDK